MSSGSEVNLSLQAQQKLLEEDIYVDVVSMPCWEAFDQQSKEYQNSVLTPGLPKIAIEAGTTIGWERYADDIIGLTDFGASAPYPEIYERLGFNVEDVIKRIKSNL